MPTVIVGSIAHELHSFVPGTTDRAAFERSRVAEGKAVLADLAGTELDGACEQADREGIRVVPTVSAFGGCGPPVEEAYFAHLLDRLLTRVRDAVDVADAVYLPLHGAMATTDRDDPEGDLIQEVRTLVGPDRPIVVSLDLHAHVTDRMVAGADAIIGYRTCPHTDIRETGARSMELLARTLEGRVHPRTRHRRIRLLSSAEAHDTTDGPLTAFQARAREIEASDGVLAVSIFATQPWLDLPDAGWTVTVTTDGDPPLAQQHADTLAGELWDGREAYHVRKTSIPLALERAARASDEPGAVVVADGADSPSAGARGDGTALLAQIIERRGDLRAMVIVTDPAAASAASHLGPGGIYRGPLGGGLTPRFFSPTQVEAEVARVTDGRYRSIYPPAPVDAGTTALLRIRNTTVVVTSHPVFQLDLEPYRRLGLDPASVDLVQAKSAGGFRAYYAPIASEMLDLDTLGPCDSDLPRLPYRRITRPLWPFDPDLETAW